MKIPSRVYWVTGLSGAGKTTIAQALTERLRDEGVPVLLLDGDEMRQIFGDTARFDAASRRDLSMRYARLCRMITEQGIAVVCATISMFDATREWNRANIPGYVEVYVRVPIEELKRRDSKRIYSRAEAGELTEVMGVNLPFEEPKTPDVIIDNHGDLTPQQAVEQVMRHVAENVYA